MITFYQVCVSFFLCISLFLLPLISFAAEGEPDQRVTFLLDEVIVTATKAPEKRRDIANAVIVIDHADIEAGGAKTIGELLAGESGITWQTYGDYAGAAQEIHVRGMKGNATQVFVNGVGLASPSLGLTDVGKIPLGSIERIEVVKGAGSLLYGSGANTINIITKRPRRDKMDFKARAGYGSQNTHQVSLESGMYLTEYLGYYLTVGRTQSGGFRENSRHRQNDGSIKLILNTGNLDISLTGNYIDRTSGLPGVTPPAGTGTYAPGGTIFYNHETAAFLDNSSDRDGQWAFEMKGSALAWLGYDLKAYYTRTKNRYYERYAYNGSGNESLTVNETLGVTGHLDISPLPGAKILLGAEYKDMDWRVDSTPLDTAGRPTLTNAHRANLFTRGFFAEAEYRPSPYIKALAGIRQERHATFGTENIPLAGLVINPSATTALKIHYGKHFMAPTFNDLYWPEDFYTRGNPALKPEVGRQIDVTAEQSFFNDKVFLAFSYFRWNIDGKIQWEPDSHGVFSPINLAGYEADGMEFETRIGPFSNMTLALSFTYLDAEEESRNYTMMDYGSPPSYTPDFRYAIVKRKATYTPEHQFKGGLTYRNSSGLTATATARYVGDMIRYRPETTVYPHVGTVTYMIASYWTADFNIRQRLFDKWILSLTGRNIFNKGYDTNLGLFTDQTTYKTTMCGYPGAGRSFFAGISYEF
jgi:iron complex outermembrane receptor protein